MSEVLLVKQEVFTSYELEEFVAKQNLRKKYILDGLELQLNHIADFLTTVIILVIII